MDKITYETYEKLCGIRDQLQKAYDTTQDGDLLFAKADLNTVMAQWLIDDAVDFMDAVKPGSGESMKCPKCRSVETIKAGKTIRAGGMRQRYQCKQCGHAWVEAKKEVKSNERI